jgi:hypothetical protein
MQAVDALIDTIRECAPDAAREEELEAAKVALVQRATGPDGGKVRDHIERAMKGELLEVRWELEEVLDESAPAPASPPPAAPEPEPEPESAQDEMIMVYDDPRGLVLHRTRDGSRWFATQLDPSTGQPATFELPPYQIEDVKRQLAGSPYWVLGSGA